MDELPYSDFIHKELIHFSIADCARSIPSLVDGLKPGQRKILYTCLSKNIKEEIRVAQLSGSVSLHSAYHHGEESLNKAIVAMAHNFVGSNNINLLFPAGSFGSRLHGGKDAASARYVLLVSSSMIFSHQPLRPRAFFHCAGISTRGSARLLERSSIPTTTSSSTTSRTTACRWNPSSTCPSSRSPW